MEAGPSSLVSLILNKILCFEKVLHVRLEPAAMEVNGENSRSFQWQQEEGLI